MRPIGESLMPSKRGRVRPGSNSLQATSLIASTNASAEGLRRRTHSHSSARSSARRAQASPAPLAALRRLSSGPPVLFAAASSTSFAYCRILRAAATKALPKRAASGAFASSSHSASAESTTPSSAGVSGRCSQLSARPRRSSRDIDDRALAALLTTPSMLFTMDDDFFLSGGPSISSVSFSPSPSTSSLTVATRLFTALNPPSTSMPTLLAASLSPASVSETPSTVASSVAASVSLDRASSALMAYSSLSSDLEAAAVRSAAANTPRCFTSALKSPAAASARAPYASAARAESASAAVAALVASLDSRAAFFHEMAVASMLMPEAVKRP
mmetsp:Transcript_13209/g.55315  ORF Transcript_13209/g.55315 Transcript_13209/m.55315 type:complete len:330 (-) Transcript_13209:471-1460(-)